MLDVGLTSVEMGMSETSQEFPIQIDTLHALKDFLDAYDNHAEMVVTEAIANAIDVGATEITIELKTNLNDEKIVSFHNNGPPMTQKEFADYHVIARSTKSKGKGIGFAGIGAKVYLAAWDNTRIHTETTDGETTFSSDMFVRNNELMAKYLTPKLTQRGTLYSVLLKPDDYAYLEKSASDIILDTFNPAISNGLEIILNDKGIRPWNPEHELKRSFTVTVKNRKFSVTVIVTNDDIDNRKSYMNYHVSGKIITTKKPEWIPDVKIEYAHKILVYVDAITLSDQLNLNKTSFKTGSSSAVSPVFKEVDKRVFDLLKGEGYIGEQSLQKFERTSLTKFFEKLFQNPKYAFLNPDAIGGRGLGQGQGTGGTSGEQTGENGSQDTDSDRDEGDTSHELEHEKDKQPPDTEEERNKTPRGGGSFSIGWVQRPNDQREGWLDPSTNKVMINMDHPLFIKYEKNTSARNQRVGTILTSVLIKNATVKKTMTPIEALNLQNELLTLAKDEMW